MQLISAEKLKFAYDGRVLTYVPEFYVEDGDYVCIVGENGAGKTTLLKGLLGLKSPIEGSICLHETIKGKLGYLPQQMNIKRNFPATVGEVVLSGCLNSSGFNPFYSKKQKLRAHDVMHELCVESLSRRAFAELSGGQQQRVLLARALCAAKRLVLMDEPVAGLDPIATEELYERIEFINSEMDITVVMVSHDIRASLKYANKILHVQPYGSDKKPFFGTKEEYLKSEAGREFEPIIAERE